MVRGPGVMNRECLCFFNLVAIQTFCQRESLLSQSQKKELIQIAMVDGSIDKAMDV